MRVHFDKDSGTMMFESQTHYDAAILEQIADLFGQPFKRSKRNWLQFSLDKDLALCPNAFAIHLYQVGSTPRHVGTRCKPITRGRRRKAV